MYSSTGGDARVPEDDLKKASTEHCRDKDLFFSFGISLQQASNLVIPCPVAATRCLFQSVLSNNQMPASVNPSRSVNFKTFTVLSLGSGSDSSSSSRGVYF
jgi:hypothetical protein